MYSGSVTPDQIADMVRAWIILAVFTPVIGLLLWISLEEDNRK